MASKKPMVPNWKHKALFHLETAEEETRHAAWYLLQTEELLKGHCDVRLIAQELEAAREVIERNNKILQESVSAALQKGWNF